MSERARGGPLLPPSESVALGERERLLGQRGATLWLTGLSGAGKSTLARGLERALIDRGRPCCVLDGDVLRGGLCADLGFSPADREENVRRVTEVARLLNDAGLLAIVSCISPYAEGRARARARIGPERFVLAWARASVDACRGRDPKGLYARADAGELPGFTGVSAPYEEPTDADLVLDTEASSEAECLAALLRALLPFTS